MADRAKEETIPLLVVCGPTASGKTRLSIDLAKRFGGEVVSADSMQVYRRMDIGTAKPTLREREGIPHHLLDILEPGELFSVADYTNRARKAIADIFSRGALPILAGGTGLYLSSVIDNIQYAEMPQDDQLRQSLRMRAQEEGGQPLLLELRDCDPELAAKLHPNNVGRIIRGLEVYRLTGTPLSQWQRRSREGVSPYRLCMIGLSFRDRSLLYGRINRRVDEMLAAGLTEEARSLWREGGGGTAGQAIGYKELYGCFEGKARPEEAIEQIKRETRRYAKRQLTWLRRDDRIHWFFPDDYDGYAPLLQRACDLAERMLF